MTIKSVGAVHLILSPPNYFFAFKAVKLCCQVQQRLGSTNHLFFKGTCEDETKW